MKNEIKLSIIIPHYNNPDLLENLLKTIPDHPQIEVIVVDDHSTAKLEELSQCKQKYGTGNITFYENDFGKKGAGSARNTGIRQAVGEYLLFADSDDWFLPNFWDSVNEAMADGTDLIYFAPISQKSNGEKSGRHLHYAELVNDYLAEPSRQNELRIRYLYMSPCSKLIKRSVVLGHDICFDEVQFSNDLMFSVKIGHFAQSIKASDQVIYCILEHGGSLTTFNDKASIKLREKIFNRFYFYLRKNLKRHDFKLLGYGLRNDCVQIKSAISVFLYEHQMGINRVTTRVWHKLIRSHGK